MRVSFKARAIATLRKKRFRMEEVKLAPEEFVGLVDVFRLLRKWRDERNQALSEKEEIVSAQALEELPCE